MSIRNKTFDKEQSGKFPSCSATKLSRITSRSRKEGRLATQDDHQARFYDNYRKVAEEYDKEFLKKYGEDLDTTLIFVGST